VRLAFQAVPSGRRAWPAFPVWGDPTIFDVRPWQAERRNLIVVSLDTLRADRLGCYGASRPTSPTLDRLAAEGALFENAIAPAPWTLPSHLTMLTGVYPCVHRLVTRAIVRHPPPGIDSLAQLLRKAGYTTAAFTENGYLLPGVFQAGFGLFGHAGATADGSEQRVAEARDWLRRHAGSPFFLFLHTYQVHWPYQSPPPYRGMFRDGAADPKNAELDDYDAALRYADAAMGALLAALEESGVTEQTIVVVTSDHGEAFNEHGITRHGTAMYEEVLRVPFIWRAPGLIVSGRRVPEVVGLADFVPTVLDLLALPIPPTVQGRSLAPVLVGEGTLAPGHVVFSENASDGDVLVARSDEWKAIFDAEGGKRLHSLVDDPEERRPGSGIRFAAAADAARASFAGGCERLRALIAPSAAGETPGAPEPPDPEQERRVRALGYVD
jgi:arylsulfatase A-like enzyme